MYVYVFHESESDLDATPSINRRNERVSRELNERMEMMSQRLPPRQSICRGSLKNENCTLFKHKSGLTDMCDAVEAFI